MQRNPVIIGLLVLALNCVTPVYSGRTKNLIKPSHGSHSESPVLNTWIVNSENRKARGPSFIYSALRLRDPFSEPDEKNALLELPGEGEYLDLKGIISGRGRKLAIIAAASGRTFILDAGSEISGGSVESVTEQCVVLVRTGGRRKVRICADF